MEEEFFEGGKPKVREALPETRIADQKQIDKVILEAVKKADNLMKYLKASWGLSKGQYSHQIGFKGPVLSLHSCENLLEPSRTGLDQFKTELTVPNLENNKYSSNVYTNSTSYI